MTSHPHPRSPLARIAWLRAACELDHAGQLDQNTKKFVYLATLAARGLTSGVAFRATDRRRLMAKTNKLWHEQNPMPKNPTAEQRIAWHIDHAKNCGCRPIPAGVAALMRARGMDAPRK